MAREFLDARRNLLPIAEELGEIDSVAEGHVFSLFALPRPFYIDPHTLNTAGGTDTDAAGPPDQPASTGSIHAPAARAVQTT